MLARSRSLSDILRNPFGLELRSSENRDCNLREIRF